MILFNNLDINDNGFLGENWVQRIKIRQEIWDSLEEKKCCYCGVKFEKFEDCTLEHLLPKCQGGRDIVGNCAIACPKCNNERDHSYPWYDYHAYEKRVKARKNKKRHFYSFWVGQNTVWC